MRRWWWSVAQSELNLIEYYYDFLVQLLSSLNESLFVYLIESRLAELTMFTQNDNLIHFKLRFMIQFFSYLFWSRRLRALLFSAIIEWEFINWKIVYRRERRVDPLAPITISQMIFSLNILSHIYYSIPGGNVLTRSHLWDEEKMFSSRVVKAN